MELDILYLQASTNIALFLLSVLGLYLNVSQFKTLTSITCCISKIALYQTTTFPCSRRSIFYLIFKLGLDIKSPVWLKSGFMVRLNFLDQNSTEFWLCSMVKLFTLRFSFFFLCEYSCTFRPFLFSLWSVSPPVSVCGPDSGGTSVGFPARD